MTVTTTSTTSVTTTASPPPRSHLQPTAERFFTFYAMVTLITQVAAGLGIMIGCAVPTPELAVTLAPVTFIPFMMVGGLFANKDRLDWFVWLEAVSPVAYAYESLCINEFDGLQFEYNQTIRLNVAAPDGGVASVMRNVTRQVDGDSVLDLMGMDGTVWFDATMLAVLYVIFRLLGLSFLYCRTIGSRQRKASGGSETSPLPAEKLNGDVEVVNGGSDV